MGSLRAQETKPATGAKVQLSSGQIQSVAGFYQSQANKEMVVQFTAGENSIIAKLLWNGGQLRLTPLTDSSFVNTEEGEGGRPLTIIFKKGADGSVTQVSVGGNGLWDKVKDYKPVVKTEMPHTPDQLKPFEGLYQNHRNNNQYLQFFEKDNKLVAKQHWDASEIKFVPQSELEFFSREQQLFSLRFTKGPDSSVTQALAFGRDVWDKLKPVHPAPADLKIYEGKYRFKDDPDDLIQVTAK
ncbi:MAG TPA: hypothetical protein VLD19_12835, partial [Chitinophagaceae bacterium]|nr:hypothetical protein [Chitinophagaceae bacterium]